MKINFNFTRYHQIGYNIQQSPITALPEFPVSVLTFPDAYSMFQLVIPRNISGLPGANIINWVITAWLHRYYQFNDPVAEVLYEKILEGPVEHHFVKKPTHNILPVWDDILTPLYIDPGVNILYDILTPGSIYRNDILTPLTIFWPPSQ